ncbi:MAG TPA: Uma2 family endonuclease [Verrucomicrobiae bacterium]|jgi:Uma2 family endonuclease|nr:Uma2 family endonuclease [Verrucomicrobiae bacterium]
MAAVSSIDRLSQAEYLRLERAAEVRSEYYDGQTFAMAGGSRWHSVIKSNLIRELGNQLKKSRCVVYDADLRVKVEMAGLYTYPDVSVACDEQRFEDERQDTLLTPTILIEVLSESREGYDPGKKSEMYRRIPSLREYVLVSQNRPQIEQFIRQPNGEWLLREISGKENSLHLPSIEASVPLSEIFANVEFVSAALH